MMSYYKVLDMWEYRVLKNWAFTTNTFMLVSNYIHNNVVCTSDSVCNLIVTKL